MTDKRPQSDYQEWIERQPSSTEPVELSVVVPCFNEERRLPPTLIDMVDYLDARKLRYEIVVVDDGGTDGTSEVVHKFERIRPQIKLVRVPKNYGKGHAVRTGVFNSHGNQILYADADGATPISELERLEAALSQGADIALGSRAMHSIETKVDTHWYRKYPGRIFNFFVNLLVLPGLADTQCGFKLFTKRAAQFVFGLQQADEFSFDVEILFIARRAGLKMVEVPVNWTNIPGSKVNVVSDGIKMLRDVFIFAVRHRKVKPEMVEGRSLETSS